MAIQAQFYGGSSPFCDYPAGGAGFTDSFFNSQQQQQQQHQQQQQLQQRLQQLYNESQRLLVDPNLLVHNSKALNPASNSIPQLEEIDQYIRLQNEKLRIMIQEQGKQQVTSLLNRVEAHSLKILMQKDEEIAQATKKRAELEDFITRLEAENQGWQKMAQENEAMALSLYKTLEEVKEKAYYNNNNNNNNGVVADDAESWCDQRRRDKEEGIGEVEQIPREMMVCKSCHSGRSCFLFLPCRHLCSCKACDAFLEACPVCTMPKKASIETLL
ncbi:hypothetical protein RIF29_32399 [Crotalaria pallida]|uniref:BOI-related E3 ubiquitin-protein ligase 3 n=1 Tax=Crotalaria pallida TaxID=3830 RepID=A0AAN9EKE9_CROPI